MALRPTAKSRRALCRSLDLLRGFMKQFISNLLLEITRRCNNSKALYKFFGIYGRDSFTVFFWRFYRKLNPQI